MQQTTQHSAPGEHRAVAGLVGVRAAGVELGLSASTVSRYLATHGELNRGGAGRPLVDPTELAAHRDRNVNRAMSGNHASRPMDATPSYAAAKAERESVQAERAALELARVKGELLDRADYEDAALNAGLMFRQALDSRCRGLAEECAALGDMTKIFEVIQTADRALLDTLCTRLLGQTEDADAA